jgi:hypothetical protein
MKKGFFLLIVCLFSISLLTRAQDIVWDFTSDNEGWNPYGDDVTTSHSGSNLVVTYTGGGDHAYGYTCIYNTVSIDAAKINKFYMKYTAHNWVKTSVFVNIVLVINGTSYYANQTMTVANGEFTFDIRADVQNKWGNLPATGTITQIRIEIPHSSELATASDWDGATLDIDRIVLSKSQEKMAHWSFDANYTDDIRAIAGTVNGNPAISASAKKGAGALALDGDGDYLRMAASPVFSSPDITYSFWMKTPATGQTWPGAARIFSTPSSAGFELAILNGNISFLKDGGWSNFVMGWQNDVWAHITLLVKGNDVSCYVNGTQSGATLTSSSLDRSGDFLLGSNGGEAVIASIDELSIFNYALTPAEILVEAGTYPVWNFTASAEGWHDLGGGRDVAASWDNGTGSLKMTYIDGAPDSGPQLWFAAIQVEQAFDASTHRYLEISYTTVGWPTTAPVKFLMQFVNSNNEIVYSYTDLDPTKNFLSIDIAAFDPTWGKPYTGMMKQLQIELPHNGAAAANPATNWFASSTLIDKIELTNTQTPPAIYSVSGSGSYCAGGSGRAVGIANSQTGVTYTLYKDGAAQTPTVAGTTGSAITFGSQTSGTYTVTGTHAGGTSDMTGSAILTEDPLPVAAGAISGTATVIRGTSGVTYTVPAITNASSYVWAYSGTNYTVNGSGTSITIDFASNATSGNLTVKGHNTCGDGTVSGNYSITANPSTTTFTGTANWSSTGNWSDGIPSSVIDAIVDGAVTVDVAAATKNLTINNSSSLTISDGESLTVNGTLANSAGVTGLVVESGGSLIESTSGVAATVKRTISDAADDKWHLFISPVNESSQASAGSCFDGAYVDNYNETTGAWERLATDDLVTSDQGYSLNYLNGSRDLVFTGTLKSSPAGYTNQSYTPSSAIDNYGAGWHLVGNPYPCGIDTKLLSVPTNANAYAYVWNGMAGNYSAHAIGTETSSGIIASLQGFFIRTSNAVNSLILSDAAKVSGGTFNKIANSVPQMLSLSVDGNSYSDKTYVRFDQSATVNFDQLYDAYKMAGIDAAPQLYSIIPGEKASVNTLPDFTSNPNVALGLKVGAATSYTISAEGIDSFDPSVPVRLDDLKTGISRDLRLNPVYSFTAAPGDAENRFMLSFASVTAVDNQKSAGLKVVAEHGIIRITHTAPATGTVYLYSVSGQLLATSALNAGETTLRTTATGVYLVRVVTGKTSLTRKIAVIQ